MEAEFYVAKSALERLHEKHGLHRFRELRQYVRPTGELVLVLRGGEQPGEELRVEIPPQEWVASLRLH